MLLCASQGPQAAAHPKGTPSCSLSTDTTRVTTLKILSTLGGYDVSALCSRPAERS